MFARTVARLAIGRLDRLGGGSSPRIRVSADSAGFEVVRFHTDLQVRNLKGLEQSLERMFAGWKVWAWQVPKWEWTHPPGVFLRKDVILGELACEIVQGCDSTGFIDESAGPLTEIEV